MYHICVIDFTQNPIMSAEKDIFSTVEEAVDASCSKAWKSGEDVWKQAIIVIGDTGKITATRTYSQLDPTCFPALVWVYAHGIANNRYYEIEQNRHQERRNHAR